jgi:hypothetical protein
LAAACIDLTDNTSADYFRTVIGPFNDADKLVPYGSLESGISPDYLEVGVADTGC